MHGTVSRVADFPPEPTWIHKFDPAMALAAFAALGSKHAHTEMDAPPHPLMHRTETVDTANVGRVNPPHAIEPRPNANRPRPDRYHQPLQETAPVACNAAQQPGNASKNYTQLAG